MSFSKKTIRDIDVEGKRVLVRAEYNVPIKDSRVANDYRIRQSLPTVQYLLERGAKLVICSHLGRPDGKRDTDASLFPVAKRLKELLPGTNVSFVSDCVGDKVKDAADKLKPGEILLLENVRFYAAEEKNDADFARQLVESSGAEVFVQESFGVVHRKHASIVAVTELLPSVAGLLLEKEVVTITKVMEAPERPLMAVVGGAKIADKIEILNRLIDMADFVAVGGAMANTFLAAQGIDVAKSLYVPDDIPLAKSIMDKARAKSKKQPFTFYIPQDAVVADKIDRAAKTRIVDWSAHVISSIEHYPKKAPREAGVVHKHEMILDIGPFSASFIAGGIQLAKTVVWNGTMGVTETEGLRGPVGPFAHGTEIVTQALMGEFGTKPFTVVGGGDTVGYVEDQGLAGAFGHVSTGGGASMELMAGRTLPGVAALLDKESKDG